MTQAELLADELDRAWRGDPWHGPSLEKILDGVDAAGAAARPIPDAHTIWELLLHLTAWTGEVTRRLGGADPGEPAEGDWPPIPVPTPSAWEAARRDFARAQETVLRAVRSTPESRLGEPVGRVRDPALGTGITCGQMLHGLAQHHAYHGGQISLLRKCAR